MEVSNVLVVDNDPALLEFMSLILQENGYNVRTAEDGLHALRTTADFHPDVVFVDLIMPNIGGTKLCQILRKSERFNDTYLIVLSAISSEEEIDYISAGIDACIAKGPFKQLGEHVFTVLGKLGNEITRERPGATYGLENLYRREITKELLSTKHHFELILDNMSESIIETTDDRHIVFANPKAVALFDVPEERLLASDFLALFTEPERSRVLQALENATDAPSRIGYDEPVWCHDHLLTMSILPVADDGQKSLVVIMNDVTERWRNEEEIKQARDELERRVEARTAELTRANETLEAEVGHREELAKRLRASLTEKVTLLDEVHHRVKNNLQIISSLLGVQSRDSGDPGLINVVQEIRSRIHSLALVHEKLYRSEDFAAVDVKDYVQTLVDSLVRSYSARPDQVEARIEAEPIHMRIDTAVPCALLVNELVTNALKYAFPEGRTGVLYVGVSQREDSRCRLTIRDDGIGLPEDIDLANPGSLGLRIVRVLVQQLDGTLSVSSEAGSEFTVDFPLSEDNNE